MTWWKRLVGGTDEFEKVDYFAEGLALSDSGNVHEALTSFRLALKESPGSPRILQQIAIAYSRIGMVDEAAKTYRHVLQKDPHASGAHYGLGFLLLRSGRIDEAADHLATFLDHAPSDEASQQFVTHAESALAELRERIHETARVPEASHA